ncbi:hypothetical protein SAMD00020551_1763 [Mesobacillus selenatarsenatis SF-1]|uniref:Uncharacterized protein n=1 Tax=Mesobacillus selenatarsenatis (strain DSM 18680 / JCM 14380 / FERM P-15431 / SF-1) TaxID=1321606 RepID=A0A0A8X107_MESS1|nr:hypothetical protein SAMD00020551_1763 [Mesobacillus selenatarsenatis SF-1]
MNSTLVNRVLNKTPAVLAGVFVLAKTVLAENLDICKKQC